MPNITYTIYNNSPDTTATINYFDITTDLSKHQHRLKIPVTWNSPFNASPYTDFTGSTTLRVRSKNYVSDVGNINYQTTAITTNTVIYLESNEGIQLGWTVSNIDFIDSGQTVIDIIGTTTVEISQVPDVVPFGSGETITFIPPEYTLDLNDTSDLEVGWSAFGNGYNGQVILNINSATQVVMSGQPSTTPIPGNSIEFSSLNDIMIEIPPSSSTTFNMDYDRITSSYGTYVSNVTLNAILGSEVSKTINNITYIYPPPPPPPPEPPPPPPPGPAPAPSPYYSPTPSPAPAPIVDSGSTSVTTTAPPPPPPTPSDTTISSDGPTVTTETLSFDDGSTLSITTVDGQISSITSTNSTDGSAGSPECFKQGTLISMFDGTFKQIEHIQVGDRVLSADGSRVNSVKYIEHSADSGTRYKYFYAPKGIEPFATTNHPILIKNRWVSADYKNSQKLYPWIETQELTEFDLKSTENQIVWNLWVDGDHTYQVNGFGTNSLVDDGGWLRISVEQGYMTKDQITEITHRVSQSSSIVAYGSLIWSNLIGYLDWSWLTKYVADMMLGKRSRIPMNIAIFLAGVPMVWLSKIKQKIKSSKN